MSFIFLPGIFFYSVHEDDIYDAYVSVNGGVHNYSFRHLMSEQQSGGIHNIGLPTNLI